jgi:hypothetical protein
VTKDDHMHLIPTMTKKMEESLSSTEKKKIFASDHRAQGRHLCRKKNGNFSLLSKVYE